MSEERICSKSATILAQHLEQAADEIRALTKAQVFKETEFAEKIKASFPVDLGDMLAFEDAEGYIIVKPRQFLGSDNFAKIAAIVRELKGEYISAGKESHFRIPK